MSSQIMDYPWIQVDNSSRLFFPSSSQLRLNRVRVAVQIAAAVLSLFAGLQLGVGPAFGWAVALVGVKKNGGHYASSHRFLM